MTVFSYNRRKNGEKGAKRPLRQRCAAAFPKNVEKRGQERASSDSSSSTSCITDTSKAVRCSLPPSGSFFV